MKSLRTTVLAATTFMASVCGLNAAAMGQLRDLTYFDQGLDGWTLYPDGMAQWSPTGGNPGGCATGEGVGSAGSTWGFASPPLGDLLQSMVFLSWQSRTDVLDGRISAPDVEIVGATRSIVMRMVNSATPGQWHWNQVRLDTLAGWTVGSPLGPVATSADIAGVLSDVRTVRLRAGYGAAGVLTHAAIDTVGTRECYDSTISDFNGDGDFGTDSDIEAFFACLAGRCCQTCFTADVNSDGDVGTDADIELFFRVLEGSC